MTDAPKTERTRVNTFKEAVLNPNTFCVTWEQIPGRGAFEAQQAELFENVHKAVGKGKIHAVSLADNPSGNPAISPEILSTKIMDTGIEPLVHFALRDKNRNECESLLYGLTALNVRNLLILTGDYPSPTGFKGKSKPVFDLDSVHGLQLVETMNNGLEYIAAGKKATLAPTDFFAGAAISPFKRNEAELMGQYYKLKKKIDAGAKFLITQVGYDARKFHELMQWMKINSYKTPLLANIYILSYGAGKVMNANEIAGCVVPDKLLAKLDEERKAKDKGKSDRLDRAAKMYAIAKGMGYSGAHIGGHGATYEMIEYIIGKGEELAPKWQELTAEFDFPQKDGFYLFRKDEKTGLNTEKTAARNAKTANPPIYMFSRLAHATLFNPDSLIFKGFKPIVNSADRGPKMKRAFGKFEHINKVALFDCMDCGDCGLFDAAFLCPMSQCPKGQRNGPCGGSYEGWCEVYPGERKCIWVRAYERLKKHHEEDSIGSYIVPPCNWELEHTSSWLNFYLGRDHTSKRLGIKPPEKKVTKPEGEKHPAPKEPPKTG
ncbi:MAG: methylenetetrahydrofolate reductase C-terminal domain-containing protein [Dehalococcoidales bacterium]|nr:methylenetetrahydrofolate reductase C-terminal domain-containing protein [Dehalococcoidales bacterium]